jgi:Bacterial regulatory proteins, tetR family
MRVLDLDGREVHSAVKGQGRRREQSYATPTAAGATPSGNDRYLRGAAAHEVKRLSKFAGKSSAPRSGRGWAAPSGTRSRLAHENRRTAVFQTVNGLFPGRKCPAERIQKTRIFGVICLQRGLDMKSQLDTQRRPYHRSNLPNALRGAARAILDEAGPDVVGLRETARRVGVSATASYRHFANKEDLLASVAAEGFRELVATMEIGATESDPLRGVGLAYVEFALQKRGLFRLMFGPILYQDSLIRTHTPNRAFRWR